ncbi:MAG: N-acetylmuramoyl-L-alanine amidase [Acidiferrobacterales bacterium]|nr:N-acetylmuramoyl-L-alanine amidase [Acidiferrobacterales bacterium]
MKILLMRKALSNFCISLGLIALLISTVVAAQTAQNQQVNNLRIWHSPESTRIVFDVSKDVEHRIIRLDNPLRLVVDIENADLSVSIPSIESDNRHIANVRTGQPQPGVLRFVFELKETVASNSFVLTPNELYGHRLVIDLTDPNSQQQNAADRNSDLEQITTVDSAPELIPTILAPSDSKPILIAIDAGHGGEDPGAIGYRGSREKEITLAIANRFKSIIDSDPRFNSFMIRGGDYYVHLHRRREIAHQNNADIFISIHADAFTKSSARGFSVFALSQRGATSAMARALAAKENAADLIGGVSLADKDEVLAKVLVDLSMTNTINESVNLGGRVLKELGKLGKLHSTRVEQAGFAVLKSPDIPSILVETGFITNPEEERNLLTSNYQSNIAQALYTAVNQYFDQTPYKNIATYQSPQIGNVASSGNSRSAQYHTVVRGDSLSKIAERYQVKLSELKRTNNLRSDVAMLGVKLKLPSNAQGTSSASQSGASRPATHTVSRGDSLSMISAKYNVTIASLKRLNGLSKDTVYLGQKIKIPGGVSSAVSTPRKHKVSRGDTLSEIAEKYGTSTSKIMQANNMRSQAVMLGQTLTIP